MNMMLKTPVATRTLHEWREAILQGILYAMLGFGSLALTSVIFKIWHLSQVNGEPFPLIRTALYVVCYGITLLATFARQTPYRFRASVPIVALTIIGVSEFYVFGVSWEGILFLCVATILATLFTGASFRLEYSCTHHCINGNYLDGEFLARVCVALRSAASP